MYAFIRVAIGEFDWSSVVLQVGQTISASRSACTAAARGGRRAGERQRDERRREQRGSRALLAESEPDALGVALLVALGVDAALDPLADEPPLAVDEERLRDSRSRPTGRSSTLFCRGRSGR